MTLVRVIIESTPLALPPGFRCLCGDENPKRIVGCVTVFMMMCLELIFALSQQQEPSDLPKGEKSFRNRDKKIHPNQFEPDCFSNFATSVASNSSQVIRESERYLHE